MCRKLEYPTIAVTNRYLCSVPLPKQMERLAGLGVKAVILREKDMTEPEYEKLAKEMLEAGNRLGVPVILHTFWEAARRLSCESIHLPLPLLRRDPDIAEGFALVGTSVHSLEEAQEAQRLGVSYMTAGHVFATDCKKGLPPRGLAFLERICCEVSVPVYGIGGIGAGNAQDVMQSRAAGVCMMSELMKQE